MKRVSVDEVEPGMRMARNLYYDYGGVMLAAGTVIERNQIVRLRSFGFESLYIYDDDSADILYNEMVDERERQKIVRRIATLFNHLKDEVLRHIPVEQLQAGSVNEIRARLEDDRFRSVISRARIKDAFVADVETIIDTILADEDLCLCVGTIKTQQTARFDHALEVALHSAVIAKKAGFSRPEMRSLLVGALLHDVGYIFIPDDVLTAAKPDAEQRALLEHHTTYGYYLLRERPDIDLLSAHVAYQHHEAQDGSGYPRGLKGYNRIFRPKEGDDVAGMIHRYADIVAVPNFYDTLISNTPTRKGIAPDEAVRRIRKASGSLLNSEVVEHFLSYLPVFPIGTQVRVLKGEHSGYRGIVAKVFPDQLEKPVIRLLWDRSRRLKAPIEVDLRQREDTEIKAIWS